MNNIYFASAETWQVLTIEQLKNYYNDAIKDYSNFRNFNDYLSSCLYNGSFETVEKITDTYYKAENGHCYSNNQSMLSSDLLGELSDLYNECKELFDSITSNYIDIPFVELITLYFSQHKENNDCLLIKVCRVLETNKSQTEVETLIKYIVDNTSFKESSINEIELKKLFNHLSDAINICDRNGLPFGDEIMNIIIELKAYCNIED